VLTALSAIGVAVSEIQPIAAVAGAPMPRIALALPATLRHYLKRRALYAAACVCAGLVAAAAIVPFVKQALELAAVERRIEAIAPRVQLAEALRKRVGEAADGRDVLAAERIRLGDPLQALAVLTELLPDDTYLTVLTLNMRKLTFAGRSAGAARLIAVLSASPLIRNPVFGAPVTRSEDGQGDLFSIHADLGS